MNDPARLRVLVVVPTFNERGNLEPLLERLLALPLGVHVLVVDDSSPDGTARTAQAAARRAPDRIHVLERATKAGRGSAVLAGLAWGRERRYEALCEMDADLSHDPQALPDLVAALASADVVIGSRYVRGGRIIEWSFARRAFSRAANLYAALRLRLPIRDYTTGYRAYRREAIASLDFDRIEARGHIVLSAIAVQLHRKGMRFTEHPIIFRGRRLGRSNFSIGEVVEAFRAVSRLAAGDRDP